MNVKESQALSNKRYQERKRRKNNTPTADEMRVNHAASFISAATIIHHSQYGYAAVQYTRRDIKVIIQCSKHGKFNQTPTAHLQGQGCPQCGMENRRANRKRKSTTEFCTEASGVHGNKYGYGRVVYTNTTTKVSIGCPDHGDFTQTPKAHLSGQGCPQCANIARANINVSHGERKIERFLIDNNITYTTQQMFEGCVHVLPLKYDFYLPDNNTLIEFDGQQHHEYIRRFHKSQHGFELQVRRDQIKTNFAKEVGLTLIRIPWYEESIIDRVLLDIVS